VRYWQSKDDVDSMSLSFLKTENDIFYLRLNRIFLTVSLKVL